MQYVVTMPDGSKWAVPVEVIARNRAAYYANKEYGGDVERALHEDTMPLFALDEYEIHDWAANNMNWEDVVDHARQIQSPPLPNYRAGWINGDYEVTQE